MAVDWNALAHVPLVPVKKRYAETAADLIINERFDDWDVAKEAVISGLGVIEGTRSQAEMLEFADLAEKMIERLRMNAERYS